MAGTLKYIDDGDKAGLKKMLCNGLLDMDDTDVGIDALLDGFKGDITDTTYISGDLEAKKTAQWSKTEAVACYESEFYVYTDNYHLTEYLRKHPLTWLVYRDRLTIGRAQ